jgi:CubicO group peptidase (beta-lactamase class C family)
VWTESIIAAGAIGAIVWVDGEAEAAGLANLETNEPMAPQHRMRVGSIDKTYMAVVAVTVFDDLDVPAARWAPQLDERITLRHLLSHRSGLFDYMWDGETYERLAYCRRHAHGTRSVPCSSMTGIPPIPGTADRSAHGAGCSGTQSLVR